MSPLQSLRRSLTSGFPRVSGDEPVANNQKVTTEEFSPRERG